MKWYQIYRMTKQISAELDMIAQCEAGEPAWFKLEESVEKKIAELKDLLNNRHVPEAK